MKAKHVMPNLSYKDAPKAIDWLCAAFGFEKHQVFMNDDGTVAHAELKLGNAMVMVSTAQQNTPVGKLMRHPHDVGNFETQIPYIVLDEVEAHYAHAQQHGAKIVTALEAPGYGGKNYSCYDIEGHLWSFGSYDPWG